MGEHEAVEPTPEEYPDEAFAPQNVTGVDPMEDAEIDVPQDTVVFQ